MKPGLGGLRPLKQALAHWRPMASAPIDGTRVALAHPTLIMLSPCWYIPAGEISEHGFWAWTQNEPEWFVEVLNPLGWVPLPPQIVERVGYR